jgi:hypothetical protein
MSVDNKFDEEYGGTFQDAEGIYPLGDLIVPISLQMLQRSDDMWILEEATRARPGGGNTVANAMMRARCRLMGDLAAIFSGGNPAHGLLGRSPNTAPRKMSDMKKRR